MGKPSYEEWYERHEGWLRYEYAEYLAQHDQDTLVDRVFWWENKLDAVEANRRWEAWLQASFETYLDEGDDHERD